jgi:hypothetical protein
MGALCFVLLVYIAEFEVFRMCDNKLDYLRCSLLGFLIPTKVKLSVSKSFGHCNIISTAFSPFGISTFISSHTETEETAFSFQQYPTYFLYEQIFFSIRLSYDLV